MAMISIQLDGLRLPALSEPELSRLRPRLSAFISDMQADKSSFYHLPETTSWERELATNQPLLAKRIPELDTFLHLGIGGSSLGAETLVKALAGPKAPKFHFFENIDPDWIHDTLENCNPEKTLVYVVSKSGNTSETLAQLMIIYAWLEKHLGPERAKNHLVFCTDPKKGTLRELAHAWKIPTFEIPPNLGGRFSVFSAVGMLPALVSGIDCKQLMKGAADYRHLIQSAIQQNRIPEIVELAYKLIHHYEAEKRNITVLMPYSQKLKTLSAWFVQLWAESLGKDGKGITPVACTGATDQHSILQLLRDGPQDKVIGFIEVVGFQHLYELKWPTPKFSHIETLTGVSLNQLIDAELCATRQVMTNNERPHFTIALPKLTAYTLGQMLFALETLTAVAGYILEVDPFDQPGVEEGKKLTHERIGACKKSLMS